MRSKKFMKTLRSQIIFFLIVVLTWQIVYMTGAFPSLMFPSVPEIIHAFIECFSKENMLSIIAYSLSLILKSLCIGILIGILLSSLSILFQWFETINNTMISIFDPLPGIAILPLAILWFGAGEETIIFIIVHSVIWPVSRNILVGFSTIPSVYIEVGKNIGFNSVSMLYRVYFPAAFPSILSGLKVSWSRAWRALISAEMIFGASGSIGGLGWYIFTKRYQLETAHVFASLLIIILIGILIEYGVFMNIEKHTIKKWGMTK